MFRSVSFWVGGGLIGGSVSLITGGASTMGGCSIVVVFVGDELLF